MIVFANADIVWKQIFKLIILKTMENIISDLRHGKVIKRLINHHGTKLIQHFQINKKEKRIYWQMFHYHVGNKAQAVEQKSYLSLKEVVHIINNTHNTKN